MSSRCVVAQVLGVLPDREPGALEVAGELQVPLAARLVPDLATHLVQRIGREHHDVKRIDAPDRVDPDPCQAVEQIDLALSLNGDPFDDRADSPPCHPHQLRDRGLGCVDRQPADLILKSASEPAVMASPRDRAHHDTVIAAAHPWRSGLHERERRPEIQRSPSPAPLTEVISRRPAPAHPAPIPLAPPRPDRHDHLPFRCRS
jgi:hypothetical protein